MNETFLHDWEPHYWRSTVKQRLVGYRSCRNCGRGEWVSGEVDEGTKSEEDCQTEILLRIGRPQFVQARLFDFP